MDIDELKSDVAAWIVEWVSKENRSLGHPPCPFALNALERNQIDWLCCESSDELKTAFESLGTDALGNEVLVIGMDPSSISPFDLSDMTKHANAELLMPNGLVALEDHPMDKEVISGQVMNQGKWALVLIQSLEKLNNASRILSKIGYYDRWTRDQMADVVDWRFNRNQDR